MGILNGVALACLAGTLYNAKTRGETKDKIALVVAVLLSLATVHGIVSAGLFTIVTVASIINNRKDVSDLIKSGCMLYVSIELVMLLIIKAFNTIDIWIIIAMIGLIYVENGKTNVTTHMGMTLGTLITIVEFKWYSPIIVLAYILYIIYAIKNKKKPVEIKVVDVDYEEIIE